MDLDLEELEATRNRSIGTVMEEDIEKLEQHLKELEEEKVLYGGFLSRKQAIENLLKILELMSSSLGNIAYDQLPIALGELSFELGRYQAKSKEDEAVIEEMASEISKSILNTCPYADYNVDLDCENRCSYISGDDLYAECWKMYFRNKAKENKE